MRNRTTCQTCSRAKGANETGSGPCNPDSKLPNPHNPYIRTTLSRRNTRCSIAGRLEPRSCRRQARIAHWWPSIRTNTIPSSQSTTRCSSTLRSSFGGGWVRTVAAQPGPLRPSGTTLSTHWVLGSSSAELLGVPASRHPARPKQRPERHLSWVQPIHAAA